MGAARRIAYDDLLALPEHLVGEIVDGILEASPRPRSRHAHAASRVDRWLARFDPDGDGGDADVPGWWILVEPEVHLGEDVLVPDIAGWRRTRMPQLEDVAWFDLAPDWVCEILSPSTARLDRARKLPAYGGGGVRHAWLIDVEARCLECYARDGEFWVLRGVWSAQDVARIPPFEQHEFRLGALWLDPPSP